MDQFAQLVTLTLAAGTPLVYAALYCAVGPSAQGDAQRLISTWYGFSEKLMKYASAGMAIGAVEDAVDLTGKGLGLHE